MRPEIRNGKKKGNNSTSDSHFEILAILLKNPEMIQEYKSKIDPRMFYEYANVYKLMTLIDEEEGLTFRGLLSRIKSADGKQKMHNIVNGYYITPRRIDGLIENAKKTLLADDLRSISKQIELATDEDPDEALRLLRQYSDTLYTTDTSEIKDMEKQVSEWLQRREEIFDDPSKGWGMTTKIGPLDDITKGFKRHDFIVIGGFTSMGKSAFEVELSLRLTNGGYKGAIFSLEMSAGQIYDRMAGNYFQINLEAITTGNVTAHERSNFKQSPQLLKKIYIDDTRGINSEYIRDTIRMLKRKQGLDFVLVDYIQDLNEEKLGNNDSKTEMISRACRTLRKAAQESDCVVFALSQVARSGVKEGDHRPTNADLANSTGIETSADMIMLLHREDYWNPDTDKQNILEVNVTKHRNGRLGKLELFYDKPKQKIYPR